ncbi:MAG: galactose mutarotase [Bacteroidales bacterium]|nr:galactose mutarotase [Bacteroidales bacterium]
MKKAFILLSSLVALSCSTRPEVALLPAANFEGTIDGHAVSLYTLKAGDIFLQVTNYGGRVVSTFVPDRDGTYEDIVVGRATLKDYVETEGEKYLGACVGPVANQISGGRFTLDGETYELPVNWKANCLHGGVDGLCGVVWDVVSACDTSIALHYLHKDGQESFPGNLDITMTYSVNEDNEFTVRYKATTDKKTPVNISHHPFFCLAGEGNGTCEKDILWINASRYTPIDSLNIPYGELADVTGTPFDFRTPHAVGDSIGSKHPQMLNENGYDHNWVIDRKTEKGIEPICSLYDPDNGRMVEVFSDQPGLQLWSGNNPVPGDHGKNGVEFVNHYSIALETQHFPDSPNHPEFPSVTLSPGETYTHTCVYRFSVK